MYPRNWHDTGLGMKIASNEYKIRSRNTILTVMSYNILADYLAQRHPELYDQGLYLLISGQKIREINNFTEFLKNIYF